LLLIFARYAFGVEIHGNPISLVALILLGALEFGGIGLLVASRARTLEAASGLMNLVMLPMWTLSGVFFSYERFPEVMQFWIKLLPLTALIDALRATIVEGQPITALPFEVAVMGAWTVVTFAIALAIFRWND
jgi:ABC-type polysaccharide/polyol phosphate export permease